MHWSDRNAALRRDLTAYVDVAFISCIEKYAYASILALIVQNGSTLADTAPITHSVEFVAIPRRYQSLNLLTNFEKWWKRIQFEQPFHVWFDEALFVNYQFIASSGVLNRELEELFVRGRS